MKSLMAIGWFILSLSAYSFTPGFGVGEDLTYSHISGLLTVSCFDHSNAGNAFFRCRGTRVDPSRYSYFHGPKEVVADKIYLESTWQNGKVVKKTKGYDSKRNRSNNPINLAHQTLTQAPLIGEGRNVVRYQFLKKQEVVLEGSLEIRLLQAESRICRDGHIISYNVSDCRNSANICEKYFQRENYCNY
ncbi:MAG: hypothetical protein A2381_19885 [Bdellovibrionales bacterium RIFOXYB1_FULL_37_110]|nr:MAG: hypothetical protein A2181_03520 [Bdellovibrionales bacterium RIFOXYA1_FULL_38_20]OFZ50999.1 MAG: hypothetical protein A2417_19670 [Bdellovibrionales bacterium RIFOXYC1_FULL_37_79]OFZ60211.1 MAG: hypothetical protein A2381_19885 [Bdellovibrionales bacterium RIFOXYB1_FULL_37_110]OFZ61573.1 MAG: hypothetical protein A2577_10325 [Bdellovibrionales bacterium RIFOXYD1_FULL_36_51]